MSNKSQASTTITLAASDWQILADAIDRHSRMHDPRTQLATEIGNVIRRKSARVEGSVSVSGPAQGWATFCQWAEKAFRTQPAIQVDEPRANSVMARLTPQIERSQVQE